MSGGRVPFLTCVDTLPAGLPQSVPFSLSLAPSCGLMRPERGPGLSIVVLGQGFRVNGAGSSTSTMVVFDVGGHSLVSGCRAQYSSPALT